MSATTLYRIEWPTVSILTTDTDTAERESRAGANVRAATGDI